MKAMPSPFPGMNPYLEHPELFPGLHHWLIIEIARFLSPQLRPKYRVAVEVRIADLYAFNLPDAIPTFPLPLRSGDSEPVIDLQALLNEIYKKNAENPFRKFRLNLNLRSFRPVVAACCRIYPAMI